MKTTFPKYVGIKLANGAVVSILEYSSHRGDVVEYYRAGGAWYLKARYSADGVLISRRSSHKGISEVELVPATEQDYKLDNEGYL